MKKPVEYKSKGPLLSRSNVDSLVMHKETVTGEEENRAICLYALGASCFGVLTRKFEISKTQLGLVSPLLC